VVQLGNSPAGLDHQPSDDDYGRPWYRHPATVALAALVLFGAGFGSFVLLASQRENTGTDGALAPAEPDPEATATTGPGGDTATEGGDGATSTTAAAGSSSSSAALAVPEGAYVEATLNLDAGPNPGLFVLTGRVPDAETAELLTQAAELSYAPYVRSELEVDPTLDPAPWLAQGAQIIGLLPSVTDGTIRVVDGKVEVEARSPNPQYLELLIGALTQLGGMPVEVVSEEITGLVPPRFVAEVADGTVTLSGEVPSEPIKALLEGGAAVAYGPGNVESTLTIDDGTYTSFWMYTVPGIFQLFTPFPEYSFQVIDGQASGTLHGGFGFEVDSTEITPEAARVLDIGVAIMARDLSVFMTVVGHTDATGPEDHNQLLSEGRATSVAGYFQAAGIGEERLAAVGAGETEPIAPNDSPEGRAINRRVEFDFGPAPSG
jgi:outer membrane protein OmpA-like peptidoglycan-associated protein